MKLKGPQKKIKKQKPKIKKSELINMIRQILKQDSMNTPFSVQWAKNQTEVWKMMGQSGDEFYLYYDSYGNTMLTHEEYNGSDSDIIFSATMVGPGKIVDYEINKIASSDFIISTFVEIFTNMGRKVKNYKQI